MNENVFFPDTKQDIFWPCESSYSHLLRYLSPHLSPLKRFIYRGSGDKGESMRDKNCSLRGVKWKYTEVSGITSGNNGNSSPNLCSQFEKNSRHERKNIPKKNNLFYTYVRVNHLFPARTSLPCLLYKLILFREQERLVQCDRTDEGAASTAFYWIASKNLLNTIWQVSGQDISMKNMGLFTL